MKPAQFGYIRAQSLDEVFNALQVHGLEAKIIAGGQSLVPMLNFRLFKPSVLIDINCITELSLLEETAAGGLRIGALTRHHVLETSDLVRQRYPVLNAAMGYVAHLAIRNRGTIGGSLSHADPAAELSMMSVLLDAQIKTALPTGGRSIAASDFFVAALMTTLEEGEIVTAIELPPLPTDMGWAFEEEARRAGDFALAATGVLLKADQGVVSDARIAVMGVDEVPMRIAVAEQALVGKAADADAIATAVEQVRQQVNPTTDLHASADYRRHLVGVLVRRALEKAWRRAIGEPA